MLVTSGMGHDINVRYINDNFFTRMQSFCVAQYPVHGKDGLGVHPL